MIIEQMRVGYEKLIKFNETPARGWVYPMKDNGLGQMIRDLDLPPVIKSENVRLAHESGSVPAKTEKVTGLSTNASCFLNLYYFSTIKEGDIVAIQGQGWKVGHVEPAIVCGEVYGKHAPVYLANLSGACDIESFFIDDEEGEIDGLNIVVTLLAGTDITALEPVVGFTGKIIDKTGVQDFTEPVEYTVTAENFETKTYTVTVEVEE
jgi:hypothetical protein